MSTYSYRLQPALQNLLQRVVQFFHPRSSCTTYIGRRSENNINASCMMISGERTEQLDIFCRVTGFTSDFLSFIVVEHIRFFHGALQLSSYGTRCTEIKCCSTEMTRFQCWHLFISDVGPHQQATLHSYYRH